MSVKLVVFVGFSGLRFKQIVNPEGKAILDCRHGFKDAKYQVKCQITRQVI